ncbi:MAG: hypothetical protein M3N41_07320 [Acidobacteriota bacterium]|nr:hypothetical protein [Acidobacteriota bacterium]
MTIPHTELAGFSATAHTPQLWRRLAGGYLWLASREMLACAFILILTLGVRAALLPWLSVPQPAIHDEFSYLLAADTYAHGRLANRAHPLWQHFESFQILQQPTYASKYQPLQGLVLAFGQKFLGLPWLGVYLSMGLLCAALCWMLQGWIAPEWALLGALLCVLRVGVLSYWMNSYLGGAVPGIGGALVLGAIVRVWRGKQFGHSIGWALGLAILALSRPYDAAVVGAASAAMLFWFLRKNRTPPGTIAVRVALPALLVLLLCMAAVGYNNYRVTGYASTLPYQVHDGQYAVAPMFAMIPLRAEPAYRHPVMRKFWADWNAGQWTFARENPLENMLLKLHNFGDFFFAFWMVSVPVLLCPYALVTAEERATVFLMLVFVLMIAPLIAIGPHYGAAFAGVFYLRFLQSLQRLWSWRPAGRVAASLLAVLLIGDGLGLTSSRDLTSRGFAARESAAAFPRHGMQQTLEAMPGSQLVLVRYGPEHDPQMEWVYNRADIDASKVVWAREMGPQQDRALLDYFHDRQAWLLEPDHSPAKLRPYPHGGQP